MCHCRSLTTRVVVDARPQGRSRRNPSLPIQIQWRGWADLDCFLRAISLLSAIRQSGYLMISTLRLVEMSFWNTLRNSTDEGRTAYFFQAHRLISQAKKRTQVIMDVMRF